MEGYIFASKILGTFFLGGLVFREGGRELLSKFYGNLTHQFTN